ncbi:MAG: alpha/beta hydrolase [Gammaproteobacteria bacterium]|nr:alpha/beta hydrolase [Gammaproteobacteria bacterium]NND37472.1 alpha/beta hydrolase [Gammaproteobacteria bacterium]
MRILKRLLAGIGLLLVIGYVGLIVYAYWPTGIEEVPAKSLASPADKFAAVDGLELRYRTFGTPADDKPNLVLLHGMANSIQSFRFVAPLLADDYYVVTVDMPGFGLSSKPDDFDYRTGNMARVVGEFIRTLGLEEAVVGGHSMGGLIAMRVALDEPEINGLVLMNPGIISSGVPPITKYLPFPFQRLSAKQFGDRDFREQFLKISYVDPGIVTEDVMDDLQLAVRSEGYLTGTTTMMGQYEDAQERYMMGEVDVPVAIVWGAKDRNKPPEELAALRDGFRQNILIEADNAGHYVHEESPEIVANGLIEAKDLWED